MTPSPAGPECEWPVPQLAHGFGCNIRPSDVEIDMLHKQNVACMPTEIVSMVLDKRSGSKIRKERPFGAMIYRWPVRRRFYFLSPAYTSPYEATGALALATLHCLICFSQRTLSDLLDFDSC